mgnify:CR=1 FL=1
MTRLQLVRLETGSETRQSKQSQLQRNPSPRRRVPRKLVGSLVQSVIINAPDALHTAERQAGLATLKHRRPIAPTFASDRASNDGESNLRNASETRLTLATIQTASDPPPTEPIPPQAKPEPGPSTYRTPAQVLDLVSSASIAPPPPAQDPDVAIRSTEDGTTTPTLSEYRASEGDARRLTRLRSLFDSLPPPNASGTTPDTDTNTKAPSTTTTPDADQCARDRKLYMRELWGQCGSSATPHQQTQTEQPKTTPRQPSPPSTASRWQAFEKYADLKERELWRAFCELDRDGDMRLRKSEVREACRRAGIELREDALDEFVRTVDRDGDGAISFDDWRDFLLVRVGLTLFAIPKTLTFFLANAPTAAPATYIYERDLAVLADETTRTAVDEPAHAGRRW